MIIELGKVTEETQNINPGAPFIDEGLYQRYM
jgi:hypothetical protein